MAVNLSVPETVFPMAGVRLAAYSAGLRYQGRDDLVALVFDADSTTAAVFTQNAFCAAPVVLAKKHLAIYHPKAILINAGNANAGTGEQGLEDAYATCQALADTLGIKAQEVLPFSTGVIGERMSVQKMTEAMPNLISGLEIQAWFKAANGILTTDTKPKLASTQIEIDGQIVTITGMAKGSGMIHPNMATMLGFIVTDAAVDQPVLQAYLSDAVNQSFNCISVDGDTSTNDAVTLTATGKSGIRIERGNEPFAGAINQVALTLAQAIVRDGEGATKFLTFDICGAGSEDEARAIGHTLATSPLVKTAMFAGDPNWGRLLAAIGRSPVKDLDVSLIDLSLGEQALLRSGQPVKGYEESSANDYLQGEEVLITVDLHRGNAQLAVYSCDFFLRICAD